jgi:hypothetical protein
MGYMKEEVKRINVSAAAESGARLPKGKIDDLPQQEVPGVLHNGRLLPKPSTVKTAVVVEGAAKKAREPQIAGNSIPQFDRGAYTETL